MNPGELEALLVRIRWQQFEMGALEWLEQQAGLDIIHFNFGGIGWFAPIENLSKIRRHLGLA
jgi:hypothetical protein